jgi:hypothetical protein
MPEGEEEDTGRIVDFLKNPKKATRQAAQKEMSKDDEQ